MDRYEILEWDPVEEVEYNPSTESTPGYLARQAVRGGAKAIESVIGLPGDIARGVRGLTSAGLNKLTGKELGIENIPIPLPSSEQVHEYATKPLAEKVAGKGYLEPQTSGERFFDDVISDFASLAVPTTSVLSAGKLGRKAITGARAGKAALASFLGNISSRTAEEMGAGETGQTVAKTIGMTVPFLLTGSGAIKKQATKLYENADEIAKKQKLPMRASTGPIQNVLDEIGKYTKGAETEGIKAMNPMVKHIKKISKGANLDLEELWKTSQKINNNFKLYQQFPDSKRFIGKIQEGIKETLRGSKDKYPEFVNSALNATDMWHGLHSSSAVRDFMHSFSKSNDFKSNATKILLAFKSVPYALKAAVLGKGTVSIVDTMETLSKSPAARGYYFKTLQAALKENGPAYIKNAKLLDKEMQKLEQPQEDRYEILEWM